MKYLLVCIIHAIETVIISTIAYNKMITNIEYHTAIDNPTNKVIESQLRKEYKILISFDDEIQWLPAYQRNNKANGQKNLRCFPNHVPGVGHQNGFCGHVIRANVVYDPGFIQPTPSELKFLIAFAEFLEEDQLVYKDGDCIPYDSLVNRVRSDTDPLLPLIQGYPTPCQHLADGYIKLGFDFNRALKGWHYGFHGSKATRNNYHVMRVYVMKFRQDMITNQRQFIVLASTSSPPWQLYCRRRKNGKQGLMKRKMVYEVLNNQQSIINDETDFDSDQEHSSSLRGQPGVMSNNCIFGNQFHLCSSVECEIGKENYTINNNSKATSIPIHKSHNTEQFLTHKRSRYDNFQRIGHKHNLQNMKTCPTNEPSAKAMSLLYSNSHQPNKSVNPISYVGFPILKENKSGACLHEELAELLDMVNLLPSITNQQFSLDKLTTHSLLKLKTSTLAEKFGSKGWSFCAHLHKARLQGLNLALPEQSESDEEMKLSIHMMKESDFCDSISMYARDCMGVDCVEEMIKIPSTHEMFCITSFLLLLFQRTVLGNL